MRLPEGESVGGAEEVEPLPEVVDSEVALEVVLETVGDAPFVETSQWINRHPRMALDYLGMMRLRVPTPERSVS